MVKQIEIKIPALKRGFHLITRHILESLPVLPEQGIINVHIKHTSAALTLNENADPTVRSDFEKVFNHLIPENQPYYDHTLEGDDDLPAHIKSSLLGNSVTIPISNHQLNLGTWQGIYLCEFRNYGGSRNIVVTIIGE
jgi:secondary thiamine-phosphate synthase enzyme